ncbi:MAG: hypothetical protein ABI306_08470 [Caulobacteraceae bacterium]
MTGYFGGSDASAPPPHPTLSPANAGARVDGAGAERLIVVVGMVREARIVAGGGAKVIVGGGRAGRLAVDLDGALAGGAAGVVSFGLCGGLDPSLKAGDLLVDCDDPAWRNRLLSALPKARAGRVVGGDAMVAGVEGKAALRERSGADGVDMESHIVTDLARRRAIPLAILRAISDPADRALPSAAQSGLKANGEGDIGAVLRALAARPWELPALIRTAREAGVAFAALRDARHLLGPRLGCPYFVQHLVDMT